MAGSGTGRGGTSGGHQPRAGQDQVTSREARTAAADEAMSDLAPTRGASRGAEQQPQRGPGRPEEAREGVAPAAAASFARDLAEMAAADPADAAGDREMGQDEEVAEELEEALDEAVETARPARAQTVTPGGEDDPEDAPATPDSPDQPAAAPPEGSPVARIRPKARASWLGLEEALEAAADAGILVGYQASLAVVLIENLTTPNWLAFVRAVQRASTPLAQGFVLKALAAHRSPSTLVDFADRLNELGVEEAVRRQRRRGPAPELQDDTEARELRMHYDPVEAIDPGKTVHEAAPAAPWTVPQWLRGIPRVPLELAIVAVDQALTEDLRAGEHTGDGASDALTAALAPHGSTHPSLHRWLLNLCARADSRGGLVHMREVMLRARMEKAV